MKIDAHPTRFIHRQLVALAGLAVTASAVAFSAPPIREVDALEVASDCIGYCLLMLYLALRIWATLYISGRKHRELQTEGPYSVTRNPLYLATFCLALSMPFLFHSLVLLGAAVATIAVYAHWLIPAEESALERMFGDPYRAYRRRTPCLLPRFSLYRANDSVQVNLSGLRHEARRLCRVVPTLLVAAELLSHLRTEHWWPRLFVLP